MRISVALFLLSLAGVVGGAYLIGTWAVGLAIIADSAAVGTYALMRDVPEKPTTMRRRSG